MVEFFNSIYFSNDIDMHRSFGHNTITVLVCAIIPSLFTIYVDEDLEAIMRRGSVHTNKGTTRGFTLIELLVVIAIIAILAAILFPVFAQAKNRGKYVQCISRLKDLGTAFSLYTDDWQGVMPSGINGPQNGLIRKPIQKQLNRYIKVGKTYVGIKTAGTPPVKGDTYMPIVFFCPSFPDEWRVNPWFIDAGTYNLIAYDAIASNQYPAKSVEYCASLWNQWVQSKSTNTRVNPPKAGISGAQLAYCSFAAWEVSTPSERGENYYYPHSNGSNCLYLDWHVKWNRDKSASTY